MGRERGAREPGGVFLLCLHQRAACAPHPRLAQTRRSRVSAAESSCSLRARHGDGTSRACHALREQPSGAGLRSCCCFGQRELCSPGQVSVPEAGSVGKGFGGFGNQALAEALWVPCCGGRHWLPVCPLPTTLSARLWDAVPFPARWDTLVVITPCSWGLWHSWGAEGCLLVLLLIELQ